MKKLLFLLTFLFISLSISAQDFNKMATAKFVKLEDYKKAEPNVLLAANFLYNNPAKPETNNRKVALAYIFKWMEGTDAYTFNIDQKVIELTKDNDDILALYFAGLTKVALDNPDKKLSDTELYDRVVALLAEYCSDKKNKVKPTKALKKVIKKMKKAKS